MIAAVGKFVKDAPPTAWFGAAVVIGYAFAAIFAPVLAPFSETAIVGVEYQPWNSACREDGAAGVCLLGTDNLGRDMLSRLIYGARNTVGIALLTTLLSFLVGGLAGLFAAAVGGVIDQIVGRTVDVLMAIPILVFALLLLTIFGASVANMIIVIALLDSTRVFRLARASAMNVAVMDFVEAARLRGEGLWWLIRREILPNILAPLTAEFGLRFCFVFLFIAALSFLGLGIQPPTADWGSMVKENATLITFGDITPLVPAGAIALLTVAVNFIVDYLLHKSSGLKE